MDNTKHKPINVHNPVSFQHLVEINSGQSIFLRLDESLFPNPNLEFSTSNLVIDAEEQGHDHKTFLINHRHDLDDWANYSSAFLGDIWIGSQNRSARLIVTLNSDNPQKYNFVTVVNPEMCDLRLKPGDIIEVVLFHDQFDENCEWSWQYDSEINCEIEFLGSSNLKLQEKGNNLSVSIDENSNLPYARCIRFDPSWQHPSQQTHMWFRLNKEILSELKIHSGIKRVGEFRFFGHADKNNLYEYDVDFSMVVFVNFDLKYRMRAFNSLLLPKLDDQSELSSYVLPSNIRSPQTTTKIYRMVKDVDVNLMDSKSLDFGCNFEPAFPPKEIKKDTENVDFVFVKPKSSYLIDRKYRW